MKNIMKAKKRDERKMEEVKKKDYKALGYYENYSRKEILREKSKAFDSYKIEKDVEKRLIKKGYITFDKKSKKLYHPDYVITEKGDKRHMKLNEIYQKDWILWAVIIAVLISLANLYFFLKTSGII